MGGQGKNKFGVHLQEESDTTQVRAFLGVWFIVKDFIVHWKTEVLLPHIPINKRTCPLFTWVKILFRWIPPHPEEYESLK